MKIIDWVKPIQQFQSKLNQDSLTQSIKNDFLVIRESLFRGDQVIIRINEGYRIEVFFIYEFGFYDMRKVTKDFRQIYKVNEAFQKMEEVSNEVRDMLKNDPASLEKFNEYVRLNTELPLFKINFYRNTKISKSVSGIPYDFIRIYIEEVLEEFEIKIDAR